MKQIEISILVDTKEYQDYLDNIYTGITSKFSIKTIEITRTPKSITIENKSPTAIENNTFMLSVYRGLKGFGMIKGLIKSPNVKITKID